MNRRTFIAASAAAAISPPQPIESTASRKARLLAQLAAALPHAMIDVDIVTHSDGTGFVHCPASKPNSNTNATSKQT